MTGRVGGDAVLGAHHEIHSLRLDDHFVVVTQAFERHHDRVERDAEVCDETGRHDLVLQFHVAEDLVVKTRHSYG